MFLINTEKCLDIFNSVYVSSDSKKILKQAQKAGAIPILRSEDLCGNVPNIPVYKHALQYMPQDINGIIAVQANSPTILPSIILEVKMLMQEGRDEVITCHEDKSIYGSVWGISKKRLIDYQDFYNPKPDVMVIDPSIDIHERSNYEKALLE